jgi:hypothetical protein
VSGDGGGSTACNGEECHCQCDRSRDPGHSRQSSVSCVVRQGTCRAAVTQHSRSYGRNRQGTGERQSPDSRREQARRRLLRVLIPTA